MSASAERFSERVAQGQVVKVDGLRQPEHAVAAAKAGVDLLGFIFAPTRRQIDAATARECIVAAREASPDRALFAVGVFVDAPRDEVLATVTLAGLDAVQLHGMVPPDFLNEFDVPVLRALHPKPDSSAQTVLNEIAGLMGCERPPAATIIDGYLAGATGGTGVIADWTLVAEVSRVLPVILAGGLNPENVGEAIRGTRPLGVDVSSGVEIEGVKDTGRIRAFAQAARAAFEAQHSHP